MVDHHGKSEAEAGQAKGRDRDDVLVLATDEEELGEEAASEAEKEREEEVDQLNGDGV